MKDPKKLYTIGQMAQLCNISAKRLRYYDENKIISPAYKDEETLYRYYTAEQMQEILLLVELKKLNLPLKDISDMLKKRTIPLLEKKLLDHLDIARKELMSAWTRYDQISELYMRVMQTSKMLDRNDFIQTDVEDFQVVDVPAHWVVYTRYCSYWNANQLFTERRAELYQLVDEYNLSTKGAMSAIFRGGYLRQFSEKEEDQNGDLEICMEIDNIKDCPNCKKRESYQAVSTIHIGAYPNLSETYQKMEEWAKSQHLKLMDIAIEEYICSSTMTYDESKYVTRVYVPLEGSRL
ncbi:MerR family transcriptional regulator [Lachnospiraceae bacterium 62-26]